mmetsp:Transcript_13246/g.28629  ORF Transcript_13246/g.28629 Transcript_13246/m.28629 type:complete len:210 (-) Transcript_13246:1192-1821(-)
MGNVHVDGDLVGHFPIGGLGGAPRVEELGGRRVGADIGGLEGHEGAAIRLLGRGFRSFFDDGGGRGEDGFVADCTAAFVLLRGGLFVAPADAGSTPATVSFEPNVPPRNAPRRIRDHDQIVRIIPPPHQQIPRGSVIHARTARQNTRRIPIAPLDHALQLTDGRAYFHRFQRERMASLRVELRAEGRRHPFQLRPCEFEGVEAHGSHPA